VAGHVGPPNACCEVKLVDVPELNYFATDKPHPRGEICIRGASVIPGYLKDEAKTRETIDEEGWLHSGDIGVLNENGTFTIIDRKKNVFKLSQGEYIAAENIEGKFLSKVPFIQQIFVHGDSHENCLVAIVIPDAESFIPFVNKVLETANVRLGDQPAYKRICNDPKLRKAVLKELIRAGKDAGLKG
jgi:long-chain acyl-CoA synthetase